jgi:hypothetical protein
MQQLMPLTIESLAIESGLHLSLDKCEAHCMLSNGTWDDEFVVPPCSYNTS